MMKNKDKLYKVCSYMILMAIMAISFIYIKDHLYMRLNSDDASELILGKLLASENSLLSKNWFYSTELRVLNTNIFYALIFKFTNDFFTVRMVSYLLMWIVLLLIYFGLCKALNIQKNKVISACLLFIPFSDYYYSFVLSTAYYIPHIAVSFLTIMLLELYVNKKKTVYLIVGGLLAILAGLGGPRQILVTYLPLCLAAFFSCAFKKDDDNYFFKYSLIVLIASGVGFVVNNKILAKTFTFLSYDSIRFNTFDIERLVALVNGFILNYGYKTGEVLSSLTITNGVAAVCILLTVYAIYYPLKHKEEVSDTYYRFSLFVLFNYIIFILLYVCTDMFYENRYYLPLIIFFVPLITLFFEEVDFQIFNIKKTVLYCVFILMVMAQGFAYAYSYNKFDSNIEKREILKVLEDGDYTNGYASFWNGNVYTELSNGEIEVWVFQDIVLKETDNFDDLYRWLQVKEHTSTKPSGKVFVLLSSDEYKATPLKKYLKEENVIYNSTSYIMFGYQSYEEIFA